MHFKGHAYVPFTFDNIIYQPRHVTQDIYETVLDENQAVTTCCSRTIVDHILAFNGVVDTSCTILFRLVGRYISAYIYHSTGLFVSDFLCSVGISRSLHIDDRHNGPLHVDLNRGDQKHLVNATSNSAIFRAAYHWVQLGYFLGLSKSVLFSSNIARTVHAIPGPSIRLMCTSVSPHRAQKNRNSLISFTKFSAVYYIIIKTLQRLVGECNSFSLAVPAAQFLTRTSTNVNRHPPPAGLEHWLLLYIVRISLDTDASGSGWETERPLGHTTTQHELYPEISYINKLLNVSKFTHMINLRHTFCCNN